MKNISILPSKIRISVVMVVYNCEKYIRDAIESVINQSYKNFEFVIVDGSSTDSTLSIINEYLDSIDVLISEPDQGQSDAFNKAFNLCSGEWLTWLNADDILLPNALDIVAKNIKKYHRADCFTGNTIWVDKHYNLLSCRSAERWSNILPNKGILNVYGPTTFFKKSWYNKVGGIDLNLHYKMDTDLWWKFFNAGAQFKRLNEYIWLLRVHEEAKTTAQYFLTGDKIQETKNKIANEYSILKKRHNIKNNRVSKLVLNLFRLTSYRYMKSVFETLYFKNKKINFRNKLK